MKNSNKKSILLLVIACISFATLIAGFILIIIGAKNFNSFFTIGLYIFSISTIVCIPCFVDGIRQYKKQSHNVDYSVINTTNTEHNSPNTTTDEDSSEQAKYCIACGCKIDSKSNFCNICGKNQNEQ